MAMNPLKQRLVYQTVSIGSWLSLASPVAAEAMSHLPFDFLLIDMEHAPNDITTAFTQLQAIGNGDTATVVRVPVNDPVWIKKALDIGSRTLLVPMVNTVAQAEAAVHATRYPPFGIRGVGSQHRACTYGLSHDYLTAANDTIGLIVQIETEEAMNQLEAIAAVEGVDALFVGPSDLAASLGHLGNAMHPEAQNAFKDIAQRCAKIKKLVGILAPSPEMARAYLDMGYHFVAVCSDLGFMLNGAQQALKQLKG